MQERAGRALREDLVALKLRQNDRDILASIVRDATGAKDMPLAHEYMRRLTRLAPDSAVTWEVRSDIDRVEGHPRKQLADLERARDLECAAARP